MDHLPQTSPSSAISSALPPRQRVNGFERPFSRDQVISWIGHSISGLSFFLGAAGVSLCIGQGSSHGDQHTSHSITTLTLVAVGTHVVNSTILITSWRSCETIDPAALVDDSLSSGWKRVRLSGPRWEKTRYCALCRKAVPGLDHHCTWLQTCIGKVNYAQFFTVACTGTVQFVLQVVYAALCLLWLHYHPLDAGTFGYVVESCFIVCLVMSVPCMFMYFVLVGFHLWLMVLGYGTYEWMLRRRKKQRVKLEAKKQKKHTTADEIISTSPQVVSMSVKDSPAVIKVTDVKLEERDRELTVL